MFKALASLFRALEVLFGAFEKGAHAVDHVAGWTESQAAIFADEAKVEREVKMAALRAAQAKALANQVPVATPAP